MFFPSPLGSRPGFPMFLLLRRRLRSEWLLVCRLPPALGSFCPFSPFWLDGHVASRRASALQGCHREPVALWSVGGEGSFTTGVRDLLCG